MKILLLGKNGQVGWELQRALAPLGELISLGRKGEGGFVGDLCDLGGLRRTIRELRPDIVVNAAAYTAVDQAEEEPEQAMLVNAEAPGVLAEELKGQQALLVHYSTDYVFDGSGEKPWQETDVPAPINQYGASKLTGEQAIVATGCDHLIFRISWVFASMGNNFLVSMQKLIQERETLNIVSDQVGAPTSAELIADITAITLPKVLADNSLCGLYHLAASGETSWHGYAQAISNWLQQQRMPVKSHSSAIHAIPTPEYPTPARRPLNSRMATGKLQASFGVRLPAWKQGVVRALFERNKL